MSMVAGSITSWPEFCALKGEVVYVVDENGLLKKTIAEDTLRFHIYFVELKDHVRIFTNYFHAIAHSLKTKNDLLTKLRTLHIHR